MNGKQESVLGYLETQPIQEKNIFKSVEYKEQVLTKVGGNPVWLINTSKQQKILCDICKDEMKFLLQIFAPLEFERSHYRVLYVFYCGNINCQTKQNSVKVIRQQLNKQANLDNQLYYDDNLQNAAIKKQFLIVTDTISIQRNNQILKTAKDQINEFNLIEEFSSDKLNQFKKENELLQIYFKETGTNFDDIMKPDIQEHESKQEKKKDEKNNVEYEEKKSNKNQERGKSDNRNKHLQSNKNNDEDNGSDQENEKNNEEDEEDDENEDENDQLDENYDNFFEIYDYYMKETDFPILIYSRDKATLPLWYNSENQWKNHEIPCCKNCGKPMIFEFQINNTVLNCDDAITELDWGIVAFYTCSDSCQPTNQAIEYIQEFATIQFGNEILHEVKLVQDVEIKELEQEEAIEDTDAQDVKQKQKTQVSKQVEESKQEPQEKQAKTQKVEKVKDPEIGQDDQKKKNKSKKNKKQSKEENVQEKVVNNEEKKEEEDNGDW